MVASIVCRTCFSFEDGEFNSEESTVPQYPSPERLPFLAVQGAVSTWSVGVTTAPRKESTLQQTLSSLANAGWSELTVFAEPDTQVPELLRKQTWCQRPHKMGMFSNWYLSLTEMVLTAPNADAYMICQDDVEFSRGLRNYLQQKLWYGSNPQVVSVYTAGAHENPKQPGFSRLNAGWDTCGALALIFPKAVAHCILSDPVLLQHRITGPLGGKGCIDSVVGAWCDLRGVDYVVHSPSLAQHTGLHTTENGLRRHSARRSAGSFLTSVQNLTDNDEAE